MQTYHKPTNDAILERLQSLHISINNEISRLREDDPKIMDLLKKVNEINRNKKILSRRKYAAQ